MTSMPVNATTETFDSLASPLGRDASVAGSPMVPAPSETELSRYLTTLEQSGQLDAFTHWVVGPAYPDEWRAWSSAHGGAEDALLARLAAHPFEPSRGVGPDDLVDVRPPRN